MTTVRPRRKRAERPTSVVIRPAGIKSNPEVYTKIHFDPSVIYRLRSIATTFIRQEVIQIKTILELVNEIAQDVPYGILKSGDFVVTPLANCDLTTKYFRSGSGEFLYTLIDLRIFGDELVRHYIFKFVGPTLVYDRFYLRYLPTFDEWIERPTVHD